MRPIYLILIFVLLMEIGCKRRAEDLDPASGGSTEQSSGLSDKNSGGSHHTAIDEVLKYQDNELSITITKGRINSGKVDIFCVLQFHEVTPERDRMERDLLCFDSPEDFIKARPEFKNSDSGTYFSPTTFKTKVGIRLLCDAPMSKSSQDPMKCKVKPFLPIGKPGASCSKSFSSDPPTRWGVGEWGSICLGTWFRPLGFRGLLELK
jgi:hypothetical protein